MIMQNYENSSIFKEKEEKLKEIGEDLKKLNKNLRKENFQNLKEVDLMSVVFLGDPPEIEFIEIPKKFGSSEMKNIKIYK